MALYATDLWSVGPEEKSKHEKTFHGLNPLNGKISGEQAKKYFMKSNLPTPLLGQIWTLSDLDKDGRMNVQEFTIAMHLLGNKLKGIEVPRVLPASLKSSTDASHHGFPTQQPLQPMGTPIALNGVPRGMLQPMQTQGNFGMTGMHAGMAMPVGMQQPMGMLQPIQKPIQQQFGLQQPLGLQQPMGMNYATGFQSTPGQINRAGSVNTGNFSVSPMTQNQNSFTIPRTGQNSTFFSSNVSGAVNKPTSLDTLGIDSLSGFKSGVGSSNLQSGFSKAASTSTLGSVSAPNRLRYTQMFKVNDHEKTGYLAGEHARQLLIQSNVNPQLLAQIWDLSDVNKDGKLELDEFIIAMHLIDCAKLGMTLPTSLPTDLIPPNLRRSSLVRSDSSGSRDRSGSVGDGTQAIGTFEDKRKMNWDKGQMELERRRRELQEREQKQKEERERKEREEEERKRQIREEAEKQRLQKLENERRQREEMEKEQEILKKKMIEQRLAAQLEAERKRQEEWEKRRKEELLNQKNHEESIVKELRNRLSRLKKELTSETSKRDSLSASYEQKKHEGLELHAAIEKLHMSRDSRMKDISRLQTELQESKNKLSNLIEVREKFTIELNQKDSTTTSEALGAIRSSIAQMKLGVTRLRKNLVSIEAETATVLKEANSISEQHQELKVKLQDRMNENMQFNSQCEQKKRDEYERRRNIELKQKDIDAQKKNQEEIRKKIEADLQMQRVREEEAMKKEKQIQETSQKQRQEARNAEIAQKHTAAKLQAEEALKKQRSILKSQNENNHKSAPLKIPPPRPRTRPQGSPVKQPMNMFNVDFSKIETESRKEETNDFATDFNQVSTNNDNAFKADFSAFEDQSTKPANSLFDVDFSTRIKTAPPRPKNAAIPAGKTTKIEPSLDTKKKQKEDEKRRKEEEKERKKEEELKKKEEELKKKEEEAKKKEEEAQRKAAEKERKRLEKEKEEIERLKKEQADQDRKLAEKLQKEEEERMKKEKEEQSRMQAEKDKEEEKKRKEADVKRKVEEMQRKRLEKKQATMPKAAPERPVVAPVVEQFVKKATYKMMFEFEARNPDELTLAEGDIVQVDESNKSPPPGWFYGTCKGASGLFPANYASKLQNDTFSDYVDLDPRANVNVLQNYEVPKPLKPKPRPAPVAETKAEPIPKLRSVKKPVGKEKVAPARPKSALLPSSGPLKPLQPLHKTTEKPAGVKQQRTSMTLKESVNVFPSYDMVLGPPQPNDQPSAEDIYAQPVKSKSLDNIAKHAVPPQPAAFPEDMYQVPGEIIINDAEECMQALALYPYRGKKDDHLSFDKNDYINVQQQQDQWWFGEANGKSGWFPKSYVKPVGSTVLRHNTIQIEAIYDVAGGVTESLGECVAMFDYSGQAGDLSFKEGDVIAITKNEGDWWEGKCNGNKGTFPANYVKAKESFGVEPIAKEVIINKKLEVATVTSKYTAASEGEISLKVGQLVHVLQKNSNGWWQGELQVRGKNKPSGWFPESHVKLMSKSKSEPVASTHSPVTERQGSEDIYSVPTKRKDQEEQVLAMFSYTAQNDDELTFYKGSVINVMSKDADWWKGELDGKVGVFPYNYVQALRSDMQETTSQWSGAFDSTLLKSMSKTERQRQNHIYELINTEQAYMNDLSLTLEVFYNPMADAKILSDQELHTVFINWKELIMCNMKLLKALLVRKKMSQTDKIEGIGDILVEQLPHFSPYIRFCSCMLNACRLLQDKVEKDPDFKHFEKKCAGDSRLTQNLSLSSYLLKPLQRITKYPLVITNILKYTPEDHFDRENLLLALEKSEDLCSQVNEGVRSQESSNRLEWLQERVNLEGLEERLVFNSQTNCLGQRKYLYHGTLHKHKSNKELKTFLFNDFLLLCRVHSSGGHLHSKAIFHPDNDMKFTIYKKPIFLNEVIVKFPSDPEVNDTLFHLSHIDRVYFFRAATKNERNTWVQTIQKASQLFIETERDKRNRATRARSLGDTEVGRLVVTILEGADLQPSDPNGTSDPYCEVSMGSQEHKTKVIPKDLNPKWNSTMVFNVKDLDQDVLCISVFDRDFFSPNDFLGRTEVSISSLLKEGKGAITKRLLLHEVATGEIVVMLELQNVKLL